MSPHLKQSTKEFFAARMRTGLMWTQNARGKWYLSPDPQLVKDFLDQFDEEFKKELKKYANMSKREMYDVKKIVQKLKSLDEVESKALVEKLSKEVKAFDWRRSNKK